MVDQTMDEPVAEGEEDEAAPAAKKKMSGKKLMLFVVPAVLLLGGGGYFGMTMMSAEAPADDEAAAAAEEAPAYKPVFFDLPDMVVNLNSPGRKVRFLKISVALEIAEETDVAQIKTVLPRIVDNFQVYLRELRVEDLRGSDGIYRLREELLRRVNVATAPVEIKDVLFKEMLVQ